MPDNRRIRLKTSAKDIPAKVRGNLDLDTDSMRTDIELMASKEDAKRMVDGGFADYLDDRGYVLYEEHTRAKDTKADQPETETTRRGSKKAAAAEASEEEMAKPGEYASPEEISSASASVAASERRSASRPTAARKTAKTAKRSK